jgi:uncharacterized protein YjbI with pentapeptide repeats
MFHFDPKFSIEVWLHHNVPSFALSIVAILANASVIDLSNNDLSNNDLSNNDLSNNDLSNNDLSNNDLSNNDLSNNARCMLVVASHVNTFAC